MNHSEAFGGLVAGIKVGDKVCYGSSAKEKILARLQANPDGLPLTKLLHGIKLPSGDGRLQALRELLAEKAIVGELAQSSRMGRRPIVFRLATAAAASPRSPTPGEPRPS